MKHTITILTLFCAFVSQGQLGYIGRRNTLFLGVGTNYAFGTPNHFNYNFELNNRLVLPKLTVGLAHESKKGRLHKLEATYQQLPHLFVWTRRNSNDGNIITSSYQVIKEEQAIVELNNYRFLYSQRFYRNLAPLGFYYELRFATNFIKSTAHQTSSTINKYLFLNQEETIVTNKRGEHNNIIPEFGFQIGNVIPINKRMAFEYGGSINLNFGYTRKKKTSITMNNSAVYSKVSASKLLFVSNFIELHANILLFL